MSKGGPNDQLLDSSGDPVSYLNAYYEKNGSLPTTWRGLDVATLASELSDLPGLKPEVNLLLKMHS